ncbi:PREDICTED: uncharacterized protein LOC105457505 [Wasmannia auropunctata]|uniref:uncharacterized protein LOC105457505 n=1 Tax=Wasmannia auropunctata TaxID=64793 RepID=UPI0005F010C4|nr:PREDICTED: uncharacterized protein LOC105457505 [Wasmannia auropunctata]
MKVTERISFEKEKEDSQMHYRYLAHSAAGTKLSLNNLPWLPQTRRKKEHLQTEFPNIFIYERFHVRQIEQQISICSKLFVFICCVLIWNRPYIRSLKQRSHTSRASYSEL